MAEKRTKVDKEQRQADQLDDKAQHRPEYDASLPPFYGGYQLPQKERSTE
jgi:hypothetical protein